MGLAEEDVEGHHEDEAEGKSYGAEVGVGAFLGFGNEFLDHYIHHGSGGKGEEVGEQRHYKRGEHNGYRGGNRLNRAAETADNE